MSISEEDKALFQAAMRDVKPLKKTTIHPTQKPVIFSKRLVLTAQPKPTLFLSDAIIEPVGPETILSFNMATLGVTQSKAMQKGHLRPTHTLDLHGLTSDEAKEALLAFLHTALGKQARNILIIHGKGSRTGETPVLKNRVNRWLRQIPHVLAFHSASPKDGGTGAVYVKLKRKV